MKTVQTEDLLMQIKDPFEFTQIIHGTYRQPLDMILQNGLNKMSRNHMHLAIGLPGKKEVISGMRSSCEIVIEINMVKAMLGEHKMPFYISENNVVLCEGLPGTGSLPPEYFRSVMDYKASKYLR